VLEADPDPVAAAASEQDYAAWKAEREAGLARASQPSIRVQTVTTLAGKETTKTSTSARGVEGQSEDPAARAHPPVHVEMVEQGDLARPGGRRFGTLVHAILATIDLDAGAEAIQASAAINGRLVGATEEEVQAAIVTVGAALGHPIVRRAAASAGRGALRRETPVLLAIDDGSLVEGVVDLAFREDASDFAGWTVVDFKTDSEVAEFSARYIAQVRLYANAVIVATGSPTRGIVLVL
jgi:ATP-dependent exoDNAse (exonuclease V) beta subunit